MSLHPQSPFTQLVRVTLMEFSKEVGFMHFRGWFPQWSARPHHSQSRRYMSHPLRSLESRLSLTRYSSRPWSMGRGRKTMWLCATRKGVSHIFLEQGNWNIGYIFMVQNNWSLKAIDWSVEWYKMGQINCDLISLMVRRYPSVESRAILCLWLPWEEGSVHGGQLIICSLPCLSWCSGSVESNERPWGCRRSVIRIVGIRGGTHKWHKRTLVDWSVIGVIVSKFNKRVKVRTNYLHDMWQSSGDIVSEFDLSVLIVCLAEGSKQRKCERWLPKVWTILLKNGKQIIAHD